MYEESLKEFPEEGKIDECIYQERQKEHRVRDICRALDNAVEEDTMLID